MIKLVDLLTEVNDDAEHRAVLRKTGFWGKRGAGCLILAKSTNRILVPFRSVAVEQPNTWGTIGGAIDSDEEPKDAVKREAMEECGYTGKILKIVPLYVFKKAVVTGGEFQYHNFLVVIPDEFTPALNWETEKFEWVTLDGLMDLQPKHFGLKDLLTHSMNDIKREIEEKILQENVQPELEFGDKSNAKWHIQHNLKMIELCKIKNQLDRIPELNAAIERAKAFIADPNAKEIHRVFKKTFIPKWSSDKDVAKFLRGDIAVEVLKNNPSLVKNDVFDFMDANLVDMIESHRAENEGERMTEDFWTDAVEDLALEIGDRMVNKSLNEIKTIACGQCFSYAWRRVLDDHSLTLVHATVHEPFNREGKTYEHAWVEKNGLVQDWQTMELGMSKYAKKGWPLKDFYELFKPENIREYTWDDVTKYTNKYKHYGPWMESLTENVSSIPTVYLDMDGVIADFNAQFLKLSGGIDPDEFEAKSKRDFWKIIHIAGIPFWTGMPWMPDGKVLYDYLKKLNDGGLINLEILSATSRSNKNAYNGKHIWARRELGNDIKVNLVERGVEKAQFATPNTILIDDKEKVINPFRQAGGIGILHTSATDTINQLNAILKLK